MVNHTFVLEKQSQDKSPELGTLREHAASIREQAMRAGDIVSSMRNLVKKTAPSRVKVDPNEIVRKSLVLLEPELRRNGISLRQQLKDPVPTLYADGVQLQQVLVNLVRNAIDAMKDVQREERVLTVVTDINDRRELEIRVSDTGHGLRAGETESVFDAFHTTKQEGIGMGLAISRSIAEAHSGRLTAGDVYNGGAVFRMSLPFEVAAQ
jgi:C4-dicarboxylate-specific signal transduction histidine kinase